MAGGVEDWAIDAWDDRLGFLRRRGFGDLEHDSHVPFLSHLVGTARLLRAWGARPALCDAGLFHSVYGTEYFPVAAPAGRDEVTALIGSEAERVAWLWCTIVRDTLDPVGCTAAERHYGAVLPLSTDDVADVAELWAADTVEQIARMAPDERAFAGGLPTILAAASPAAQAAVAEVADLVEGA